MLKHRYQETAGDDQGGGGGADWRASFGAEAATSLKDFKEPGDFLKAFNDRGTELNTLKTNAPKFDWRKEIAGDDQSVFGAVERFTDAKLFGKAFVDAQKKIRSGELAKPLPENPTPEQLKEWRAANGVPEEAKGYFAKLPEGLVIGKEDQKYFDGVAEVLHKRNVPTPVIHDIAKWFYDMQTAEAGAVAQADRTQSAEATAALREKWGNDFAPNMGQLMSLFDGMGKELKAEFMDATLPDGRRIFNHPGVIEFFASKAREINPAGGLLPPGSEGNVQSIDSEIDSMKKLMADRSSAYWKGDKAEAMQAKYRKLITARERLKERVA